MYILLASSLIENCQTSSKSFLSIFADFAVNLVDTLGAVGVILATMIETIFPFIPSEIVLPLVGATASLNASFNLVWAIVFATLGAVTGASVLYYISYAINIDRVKWLFSKVPLVSEEDIDTAIKWFSKFGYISVFVGRFIPVVRVLVSIPAGLERMKIGWFILWTSLGSLIWNTALIVAGFFVADQWCHIEEFTKSFTILAVIILLCLIALYVVHIVKRAKRKDKNGKTK